MVGAVRPILLLRMRSCLCRRCSIIFSALGNVRRSMWSGSGLKMVRRLRGG